jgi:tight adherence protein C
LGILPYIVGPAIGVYIPILYVKNLRNQRVSEIRRIFPDALEMLALCNEASMTIDMALSKIARELEKKYPVISEEFLIIGIELALLDSRAKAFDGFYKRFPLDEVRSFVTTINQAERSGTPIATFLRTLSKEMRKDSLARIQAKLESLASKLVVPLILFFFVPMMIFMVYPIFNDVDLSGM